MTFKELKKRVTLELTQQQSKLSERLYNKPFGYGTNSSINLRISEQMEIAVTVLDCAIRWYLLTNPKRIKVLQ